jgi:hypothetical protein
MSTQLQQRLLHVAVPVAGRGGPQDCGSSRLPRLLDNELAGDGDGVVSLKLRPAILYPNKFLLGWIDCRTITRLENQMNSSGIDPATLRCVAHCFYQTTLRLEECRLLECYAACSCKNRSFGGT